MPDAQTGTQPVAVTFRPMVQADMRLFARWVRTPAVAEWWREEAAMSDEQLGMKMSPRVLAAEKVSPFIFSINGSAAGYIQSYRVDDWPESLEMYGVPGATGIDLFIGEEDWLHKGYGALVLREFINRHVFSDGNVSTCVIDPETTNVIAVRAYEKAGFRRINDVISPEDGLKYTIMRLDRG